MVSLQLSPCDHPAPPEAREGETTKNSSPAPSVEPRLPHGLLSLSLLSSQRLEPPERVRCVKIGAILQSSGALSAFQAHVRDPWFLCNEEAPGHSPGTAGKGSLQGHRA